MELSKRALRLQPSATLAVVAKAKAMKREGKPVISFGAGEPDFNSPKVALDYATQAMRDGMTHYTPGSGIPELKEAVCAYYKDRFNLGYEPNQVIIGAGAKVLLYEALSCVVNPGDEVLVFAPAWVSYVEQIRLCEGKEVIIDTSNTNLLPDLDEVRRRITPKTKCMMLNTPNNPTGAVYDEKTLRGLAEIAVENDLYIIFDEIYEQLVYDDAKHHQILNLSPDVKDRTIIVNGVSKAYAMTGWRIGYALGSKECIAKMGALQGHLTSNPCSIAQYAALGALKGAADDTRAMHAEFSKRRSLILDLLSEMPLISFIEPKGAFYVPVDVSKTFGMKYGDNVIKNDMDFCSIILDNKYVAITPGTAFFAPGYIRLSYSNSQEDIKEGMKRLNAFLKELKK